MQKILLHRRALQQQYQDASFLSLRRQPFWMLNAIQSSEMNKKFLKFADLFRSMINNHCFSLAQYWLAWKEPPKGRVCRSAVLWKFSKIFVSINFLATSSNVISAKLRASVVWNEIKHVSIFEDHFRNFFWRAPHFKSKNKPSFHEERRGAAPKWGPAQSEGALYPHSFPRKWRFVFAFEMWCAPKKNLK